MEAMVTTPALQKYIAAKPLLAAVYFLFSNAFD
jgi:hypothetical protein